MTPHPLSPWSTWRSENTSETKRNCVQTTRYKQKWKQKRHEILLQRKGLFLVSRTPDTEPTKNPGPYIVSNYTYIFVFWRFCRSLLFEVIVGFFQGPQTDRNPKNTPKGGLPWTVTGFYAMQKPKQNYRWFWEEGAFWDSSNVNTRSLKNKGLTCWLRKKGQICLKLWRLCFFYNCYQTKSVCK